MFDPSCMYCAKGEKLASVMLPVCEVDGYPLYLYKNQMYRGRVVLAYSEHIHAIADMSAENCVKFFLAVRKTAKILTEAFAPDQINIGMYADKMCHLHCHIVPKYEGGPDWGGSFRMNSDPPVILTRAEYAELTAAIQKAAAFLA